MVAVRGAEGMDRHVQPAPPAPERIWATAPDAVALVARHEETSKTKG
jgi:hypothetical protein